MNNLSSYCGLVDAKIRASDKDLPAHDSACLLVGSLWNCRPVISMMFLNLDLVSFTFNVNETKLRMNETLLGNRLRKLD